MAVAMRYGSGEGGNRSAGVSMKLLWTNPTPTANFAAQTVALNLSGYQALKIKFVTTPTGTGHAVQDVLIDGEPYYCYLHNATTGTQYSYIRMATATNTGVEFSTGYRGQAQGAGYMIPLQIYGIRGIN